MIFIKSLDRGARSIHGFNDADGSRRYDLPQPDGAPGAWKPSCLNGANGTALKPHFWGYHLAYPDTIADWFHRENYIAEAKGRIVKSEICAVAEQMRLTRHLPIAEAHWTELAAGFAEKVFPLLNALHFPRDHGAVIERAFAHTSRFLQGADAPSAPAVAAWKSCVALAGRCEIDSQAAHDWLYNSQAAQNAALAVAALGFLRRSKDGARLYDFREQKTVLDKYISDRSTGMGLLFARGERLLDAESDNFRVAKDVSGYAAKAANQSVLQSVRMGTTLTPLQQSWVDQANPRLDKGAGLADRALSGMRRMQSLAILACAGLPSPTLEPAAAEPRRPQLVIPAPPTRAHP